jgi:hypothetical protein
MDLKIWQRDSLAPLRELSFLASPLSNVTVVAYYFQEEKNLDVDFWRTEFAFLKTFQTQGFLPSVLVVNQSTPIIDAFCGKYGIQIQIERDLKPGCIKTLALDLIGKLYTRFTTDYVLVIQDDGFPVRPGLEEFVGKYDYIGAPWVCHNTYYDLYPYRYCVGNGGFSLRSRRVCEAAARYYNRYFKHFPYWWYILGDDTFYCKTLRFWFSSFRKMFKWASPEEANRFSVEHNLKFLPCEVRPLGFHGEVGFRNLRSV